MAEPTPRAQRLAVSIPVTFAWDEHLRGGLITNLGPHGLFLTSRGELPAPGTRVSVQLPDALAVGGTVRWISAPRDPHQWLLPGMGLALDASSAYAELFEGLSRDAGVSGDKPD